MDGIIPSYYFMPETSVSTECQPATGTMSPGTLACFAAVVSDRGDTDAVVACSARRRAGTNDARGEAS
uniref:Uncharacterized protein n=1 Tax=Arundo donax TaxID=35708 RepID=A0A0A9FV40_ARUDO